MLRMILALALMTSLAACSTRLNPFNWFGNDREERVRVSETVTENPRDRRFLVSEVVAFAIDPTAQGVILRAIGRPQTQGHWEADLVEVAREDGALVYEFRVFPPPSPAPAGTPQSREVITGLELSNFALRGIRTITVVGAENRRTISRR
ncbi:hypothetical protein [Roseicyclus sp.]|uniref:hypothetical protein n=1 Tax=Roseicyclus sp. TaxID=1914329 RepID=UPI003F6C4142